jgi:hypothetical protein
MAPNVNVQENWNLEPELMESPPRRVAAADFKDFNRPNVTLFMALGGALVLIGIVVFALGMSAKKLHLDAIGFALTLLGVFLLVYIPYKARVHDARAENLVTNGLPVLARLLSADNVNNSPYMRSVKYQYTTPQGDVGHKDCNVDDRALPKRIPSNVTALLDMQTGDIELYCALPLKAVPKSAPATTQTPASAPPAPEGIGTISTPAPEPRPAAARKPEEKPRKRESYE